MLRFTIRDVLWLMLVVGLVVGWFIDHKHLATIIGIEERWRFIAEDLRDACTNSGWTIEVHHAYVVHAKPPDTSSTDNRP